MIITHALTCRQTHSTGYFDSVRGTHFSQAVADAAATKSLASPVLFVQWRMAQLQ